MTEARFRAALGTATILMLALSWPLWVEESDFPRVPFVPALPTPPAWASGVRFGLLIGAIAAGIAWRRWLGAAAAILVHLVLEDQHRFQPWTYQFLMAALALAATSEDRAVGLCRLFLIALYFHSGLSKLDVSFGDELGLKFLETAAGPFGLHPTVWPIAVRRGAVLAMPAAEILIALALAFGKTRRVGLVGAVGLHAALIAILGPWGLGHSPIVLVWNAALIVEDLILFGSRPAGPAPAGRGLVHEAPGGGRGAGVAASNLQPSRGGECLAPVVTTAFLIAALLPFGERRGWCDTWPAFALYASHAERADVSVPEGELGALPESIRRFARGEGAWRRIDLTAWSRAVRGVPVYPQGRASLGVAEALAVRYRGARAVRVDLGGRADRWTGRRAWAVAIGRDSIRALGDRCRLNAHPAGPGAGKRAAVGTPDAGRGGGQD